MRAVFAEDVFVPTLDHRRCPTVIALVPSEQQADEIGRIGSVSDQVSFRFCVSLVALCLCP